MGYGIKKEEFISDCSDIDDIIAFRRDGKFIVPKIGEKVFVGKDIIHIAVWLKNDDRTTYHVLYVDGKSGFIYGKRFNGLGITRDKEYDLTMGHPNSKILYFSANPNGEAERVQFQLSPSCKATIKIFDFDFATLAIKGTSSQGNIITKHPVKKITQKEIDKSTIGGQKIWLDDITHTSSSVTSSRTTSEATMSEPTDLVELLRKIGLRASRDAIEAWLTHVAKANASPAQTLEQLCTLEQREREARNLARRAKMATLGTPKSLDRFDWNHPRAVDRELYEQLHSSLDFVRRGENILLRGQAGVGKSTLAQNLGLRALERGYTVRFCTLPEALADLLKQESIPATERPLRRYTSPDLLVLDELGSVPCDSRAADLLFNIVSRRHE